jgi:hypothetical protein
MQRGEQTEKDSGAVDEDITDIIEADCKFLLDEKTCSEKPKCHWLVLDEKDPGRCKRDGTTVTTDELNQMLEANLQKQNITSAKLDPLSIQAPDSGDKKVFVVKKLPSDSDKILSLRPSHFLKFRRNTPYSLYLAHNETPGLKERKDGPNQPHVYKNYIDAKARFESTMNKNPIFLYAHEQPVEVLLPKEYAGTIGTVSIMPKTFELNKLVPPVTIDVEIEEIRTLVLPNDGPRDPGKEKMLSSRNTTVLFYDEYLMEMQMRQQTAENLTDPKFTRLPDDADNGYYTDDEKLKHPPLPSDYYWEKRDGNWIILGYAGGGRRTRRTGRRRSRRTRKTRTLRKRNGCKLRKRCHTKYTRPTRPRK